MSFHTVPKHFRRSHVATVDHRMLKLGPARRSDFEIYLDLLHDIVGLEDGPFDVVFTRDDGSVGLYSFAFRGRTRCGKRLAIAVDDEAYARKHDLEAYLLNVQKRLPPDFADEIRLLTERKLDSSASSAADH